MTRRRGESHTLLWVGMGCGGALLALLVLGGGVTALWALGYLGQRGADAAGAKSDWAPEAAAPNPVAPFLPAGDPFAPGRPGAGRLTAANCEKVKPGMTEAEVRGILGPPTSEVRMPDMLGAGGAAGVPDHFPAKVLNYQEFFNQLQVSVNAAGRVVTVGGTVGGKIILEAAPPKNPFDNPPPGQQPPPPFERFPANPFFPGGAGMPGNPFAPPGAPAAPPQRP